MALHTTLPIYKVAYDLFDYCADLAANMRREYKQGVGGKLRDEALEISTLVFRANVSMDKTPHLTDLIERVQVIELLLRLSCDKRLIAKSQYATAIEMTQSIGKQAGGWRKSANRPLHDGQGRHD